MTYIGAVLLLISSFLIGRGYSSYLEKGIAELDGFLNFIKHIRLRVAVYAEPISRVKDRFYDDNLDECGFIGKLRDGQSLKDAYEGVKDSLVICTEAKDVLESFFSSVGHAYIESEIRNLDYTIDCLTELSNKQRGEAAGRRRAVKASLYALALGISVLVI